MKRVILVTIVAALAAPRLAHAGRPKYEFLCGTFKDGAALDVLPSAKKPKIVDSIGCALRVTGAPANWEDGPFVLLTTYDKKTKQTAHQSQVTPSRGDDGAIADIEWMMNPGDKDESGTPWFTPCDDFDIEVQIQEPGSGTLFDKKLHIAQACPKPKQISAKVTCTATQSGDSWKIPSKTKYRMSDATIACVVAPKDKRAKVGNLFVTGWISHPDGTGQGVEGAHHDGDVDPIDEGTWVQFDVNFTNEDYTECMPGTMHFEAKNEDGQVVFTKDIDFDQTCDD